MRFELSSPYAPAGDQPQAIRSLIERLARGDKHAALLGVTGSGKTFTVANVIAAVQKPVLVISHNKTLVAQLYSEFKDFFPKNAVEYFVSYFDYYQPEAYVPQTDTFIEKDSSINEDIDRLRLRATSSLLSRRDCIVVASVSCIYGLGSPRDYEKMLVFLSQGKALERDALLEQLVAIRYERNDIDFKRGTFRARGDTVDIYLAYEEKAVRVIFDFDTLRELSLIDPLTSGRIQDLESVAIYPAKHYVTTDERIQASLSQIESELEERVKTFNQEHKFLEAQRIQQRTRYDLEMMEELGYCSGIENYSRYLSGRAPGEKPYCLLDYYPEDFLVVVDESHVTLPQIRGMYQGDRSRKQTLVEYGFRLPSALDNRPLQWEEFLKSAPQMLCVSATLSQEEIRWSGGPVEQVIRPTGLLDPEISVRPTRNQMDDLIREVQSCAAAEERVLVTTLTKRMAEDLARFLEERGVRVKYLHSDIDTIQRVEIIRDLRKREFDCLVGINLLREGLDIPEVSLVAILDADKEGFLRSETSLIQTAGRAARHERGRVILYADTETHSMRQLLRITEHRRRVQDRYNKIHGITPRSVIKGIGEGIEAIRRIRDVEREATGLDEGRYELSEELARLEESMEVAARNLQFEKAILYRDRIDALKIRMKAEAAPGLLSLKKRPSEGSPKRLTLKPAKKKVEPGGPKASS